MLLVCPFHYPRHVLRLGVTDATQLLCTCHYPRFVLRLGFQVRFCNVCFSAGTRNLRPGTLRVVSLGGWRSETRFSSLHVH